MNQRPDAMIKVYTVSLGCPKNRVDTERLLGTLANPWSRWSRGRGRSSLINTCAHPARSRESSHILEPSGKLKKQAKATSNR